MSDHTPDALASALPAGIVFDFPQGDQWGAHEIAGFQAEELAEDGYVLLHPEFVDEATIERLAAAMRDSEHECVPPHVPWQEVHDRVRERYLAQARTCLAALAGTSAQARHTDGETGGGACTCVSYVVDHSHPEPRHPENVDTELTPGCPEHDPEGVAGE